MKQFCLAAIALLAAGNTFAGTQTWDFGSSAAQLSGSGHGNELVLTSGTGGDQVTLTVSAWASTDNLCNADGKYDTTNTLPDADPCIRDAELKRWSSGLGIVNRDEDANNDEAAPQHAIDNIKNGASGANITNDFDYEMVLLSFSSEVNLSKLNIGWSLCGNNACNTDTYSNGGRDADISVLAHNGSSQDFFNAQTKWSDITSQGWSLVSNYSNLKTNQPVGISTSSYSKHWLVGAYNNVFDTSHWSVNNDAFKFAGLSSFTKETSTAEPVSAPATLGLFGLITLGLLYLRKK